MNNICKVVWSHARQQFVVASEIASSFTKSHSTSTRGAASGVEPKTVLPTLRGVALAVGACMLMGWAQYGHAETLPQNGQVVAGTGTIATSGNQMTINQSTAKLAIDWQSFSIGPGTTVEFVQPSSSAVSLNRVLGTDVSVIQGALKANGQVFLVNPNGVVFNKDAQVNVGGIVASTLNIKTDDFMLGNYRFEGGSSSAVVNQGNITTVSGGSVALIAAKITNTGHISAERGKVLMGAGRKVKLDLGGPVKIEVEEAAIEALIEQGGGVRADGGLVYLTAKAVGQLTATVINHTGLTEARTLATGETGQIYLMGGLEKDRILVGGKLVASAPNGGDGGFIETSASRVAFADDVQISTAAVNGQAGHWLIDPVDFKIAASGGDITGTALGNLLNDNSVTIQTSTGTNSTTNLYGTTGSNGDIIVSQAVTKSSGSATTLTLAADRDIVIYDTAPISGSSGSPLNVVLAARANGGGSGTVTAMGTMRTYGGNITIGGGDLTASGFATASATYNNPRAYGVSPGTATYYTAGVDIGAMLDATVDGSGVANASLPTAASGGHITVRGRGSSVATSSYNWGVHVDYWASRSHYATIVTGGGGSISIVGYGGNGGSNNYALGSVGIALEGSAYLKSNTGNITLKGYQGTGIDRYGIVPAATTIGTKGWLLIDGDSLLLRGDTLTIAVGQDSDIKTPIVGCNSTAAYGICGSAAAQPKLTTAQGPPMHVDAALKSCGQLLLLRARPDPSNHQSQCA